MTPSRPSKARSIDVVIVVLRAASTPSESHGRVQKRSNVCSPCEHEGAPHEILLVLDATSAERWWRKQSNFRVTWTEGLVMTKLDGTAREIVSARQ